MPRVRPIFMILGTARSLAATLVLGAVLVLAVELIARGSLSETLEFFTQPYRPAWATVALVALILLVLDAILGRAHQGILIVAPLVMLLAAVGRQKAYYLGDPLYPADFLYGRQIVELLPLLVRERIGTAAAIAAVVLALLVAIPFAWRAWNRRGRRIRVNARAARLALAVPLLAVFASMLDYASFSLTRDRLWISPMMWDQKANYAHNGFTLGFALNLPMAKITAPEGYDEAGISAIVEEVQSTVTMPENRPDIIVVMSESFWDPTRLPGVTITPDPIASVRSQQSGHIFSPEFGGMTANVEFEALTGFSNAFLPYGSIPYQQYVRDKVPSLPSFLGGEGYHSVAIHPFSGWFWNRSEVYSSFGFQEFLSEENLPEMPKRGHLASDAALTDTIIGKADATEKPLFLFAVSLQSHGPYEPGRYPDAKTRVAGVDDAWSRESIASFSEGMADADAGFQRLIDWAGKRERATIIVFFGDHLPPLGPAYVATGFLEDNVAPRIAPVGDMLQARETPLVVWSNRTGPTRGIGTVSPAFLPLLVLREAGIDHPYYTGVLGSLFERYRVVDRHLVIGADGMAVSDWSRAGEVDPALSKFRLLQHDILFGERFGESRLFPKPVEWGDLLVGAPRGPDLPYGQNPV